MISTAPAGSRPPSPAGPRHRDAGPRYRDAVRLAGTMAGVAASTARAPLSGARGRRRLVTCAAARTLTALGVRVEVHASPVAWPRSGAGHGPGLLVLTNRLCWLGDLALLTAVPAVPVAHRELLRSPVVGPLVRRAGAVVPDAAPGGVGHESGAAARRVAALIGAGCSVTLGQAADGGRSALVSAAVSAGAAVCPAAVRYRGTGPVTAELPAHRHADQAPWRDLADPGRLRGLVIEVHLLPALPPVEGPVDELVAAAERMIVAVAAPGSWSPRPTPTSRAPRPGVTVRR